MLRIRNWLNGWRRDMDEWIVRARRETDPDTLRSEVGFVEESAIAVRTHEYAAAIDAGRNP